MFNRKKSGNTIILEALDIFNKVATQLEAGIAACIEENHELEKQKKEIEEQQKVLVDMKDKAKASLKKINDIIA